MRSYLKRMLSSLLLTTILLMTMTSGIIAAEIPSLEAAQDGQPETNGSYYETHRAYMFGDINGNFRPNSSVTRAEAAALMVRTQLLDFESGINYLPPNMDSFDVFADISPDDWFFHYVAWAYDAGLIYGINGNFRPNADITREEFAALLARTTTPYTADIPFADAYNISDWALAYVHTAFLEDWIRGDQRGNFRPKDPITRAEVATSINRMFKRLDSFTTLNAVEIANPNDARRFHDLDEDAWYFPAVLAATNDHRLARNTYGIITWLQFIR